MSRLDRERGFTLIELLIVVAILGILAAVVIPNVGRFLGRGQDEARRAEFHDIGTAVTALMTENNLSTLTPSTDVDAGCDTGTRDLTAYPDNTASLVSKQAQLGGTWVAPDKLGYVLYGHDMTGDSSATPTVNYVNFNTATYCYTVDSNGTVHQYLTDGTEQTD